MAKVENLWKQTDEIGELKVAYLPWRTFEESVVNRGIEYFEFIGWSYHKQQTELINDIHEVKSIGWSSVKILVDGKEERKDFPSSSWTRKVTSLSDSSPLTRN